MSPSVKVVLLASCLCAPAFAQYSVRDRVVLPASKTSATVTITLPAPLPATPAEALPVTGADGKFLSPQPEVTLSPEPPAPGSNKLKLDFIGLYFWGEATLPIRISPTLTYTVSLSRGPVISSTQIEVEKDGTAAVWLYNYANEPLKVRWRVISGNEGVCGITASGVFENCRDREKWYDQTIESAHNGSLVFGVPSTWFNPWAGGTTRDGSLELRLGDDAAAPARRVSLRLSTKISPWSVEALRRWLPAWAGSLLSTLLGLLGNALWVSVGAALLMAAQVMIPNFRKILHMEDQVEQLEERIRAINSRVGDRLLTRCQRELQTARKGLLMLDLDTGGSPLSGSMIVKKIGLAGYSAEVALLSSLLARIESRVHLTELLDERLTAVTELDSRQAPPGLLWKWEREIRKVQTVLSRQLINEADEKAARAGLDGIAELTAGTEPFVAELKSRIAALRRRFAGTPCMAVLTPYLSQFDPCMFDVLNANDQVVQQEGLTMEELAARDIAIYRYEVLAELLALQPLLGPNSPTEHNVLSKLESTDPNLLTEARALLTMQAQGVDPARIVKALRDGMWDVNSEPVRVLEQDVLRVSFAFREKALNSSAARTTFQCLWMISSPAETGDKERHVCEQGWDVQVLVDRRQVTLTPEIYDSTGGKLEIRESTPNKGVLPVKPGDSLALSVRVRIVRGMVDALITAVVPVITVAITQFQSSGTALSIDKLVLLGFTSQAIRGAIVSGTTETEPPKT